MTSTLLPSLAVLGPHAAILVVLVSSPPFYRPAVSYTFCTPDWHRSCETYRVFRGRRDIRRAVAILELVERSLDWGLVSRRPFVQTREKLISRTISLGALSAHPPLSIGRIRTGVMVPPMTFRPANPAGNPLSSFDPVLAFAPMETEWPGSRTAR